MTTTTAEKIKNLVKARLEVLPDNAELSIVGHGTFNKKELLAHVKADDEIGQKIIKIELEYLKSLKKGVFYA